MIAWFSGSRNWVVPFTKIRIVRGESWRRWHRKKMNFGYTEFKVFAAHPGKVV